MAIKRWKMYNVYAIMSANNFKINAQRFRLFMTESSDIRSDKKGKEQAYVVIFVFLLLEKAISNGDDG